MDILDMDMSQKALLEVHERVLVHTVWKRKLGAYSSTRMKEE